MENPKEFSPKKFLNPEEIETTNQSGSNIQFALPTNAPRVDLQISTPIPKSSLKIEKGQSVPINIEGFELLEIAGKGSQAVVFRARELNKDRIVALKILNPNTSSEVRLERFIKEARILTEFDHPNLIKGYSFGESNGYQYFVMEYFKGLTLQEFVTRFAPMNNEQILLVAEKIAYALIYANSIQLIHRDIKPDNIMIGGAFQQIKLCDLGLAKAVIGDKNLTQVGQIIGTPNYISPEIAKGEKNIDIRSDIYSLGATLYFLSAGKPPFIGVTSAEVMRHHIIEPLIPPRIVNPSIDPFLSELIENMMRKEAIERPQTPEVLLSQIQRTQAKKSPLELSNLVLDEVARSEILSIPELEMEASQSESLPIFGELDIDKIKLTPSFSSSDNLVAQEATPEELSALASLEQELASSKPVVPQLEKELVEVSHKKPQLSVDIAEESGEELEFESLKEEIPQKKLDFSEILTENEKEDCAEKTSKEIAAQIIKRTPKKNTKKIRPNKGVSFAKPVKTKKKKQEEDILFLGIILIAIVAICIFIFFLFQS